MRRKADGMATFLDDIRAGGKGPDLALLAKQGDAPVRPRRRHSSRHP